MRVDDRVGAGDRPDYIRWFDPLAKIPVSGIAEIRDIASRHRDDRGIALERMPHGADEREIAFVGACEDQPPVAVLEHIDAVGIEQAPDDNLADPGGADARRQHAQHGFRDRGGPGAGGIGQRPRRDHLAMAAVDHDQPPDVEPVGANATRAGADHRAPLRGIDGIGDHQPRIVHHAIGIFKRGTEWPLQRVTDGMVRDVDRR